MLWVLFEECQNYFMEMCFPKAMSELQACLYMCVYSHTLHTQYYEKHFVASLLFLQAYFHTAFLSFLASIEFLSSKIVSLQIWLAATFCYREKKGVWRTECSVFWLLGHSNMKSLRNLAAREPDTAWRNPLILPFFWPVQHHLWYKWVGSRGSIEWASSGR